MIIYMDDRPHTDFNLVLQAGQQTQMIPSVKRRTKEVVGRHGQYKFGANVGARLFKFPFTFAYAGTQEELEQHITAFADFLLNSDGTPRPIKLNLSAQPNQFYTVEVADVVDMRKDVELGEFILTFVADYPFAYSDLVSYTFLASTPTVTVEGSMQTYPVIKATCKQASSYFIIRCGTGEDMQEIRINYNFIVGDTLEIDCQTRKVVINNQRAIKYLQWQTSKFFALEPSTNPMQLSPSSSAFQTTMTYTPTWL